ncbi:MAG: hypothetical protein PVI89_13965 [Desulfobacteraceae bacterium]|jgi:hypothetical protein
MIYGNRITTLCIAIFFSLSLAASAGEVPDLVLFENGTQANADQVNDNFDDIKKAVNDNHEKILILSKPGSVTYSAMGFTAGKSQADFNEHNTEYEKVGDGGFLSCSEEEGCYFYQSVTLRTGVTITKIRVHALDVVNDEDVFIVVKLQKKVVGENAVVNLASITSDNSGDQVMEATLDEPVEWSSTNYPPSYFIEAFFSNSSKNILLYSVTIDFTYTTP